jgi:predicted Zn finger-like uncharacterized protein
VYTQCPQCQTLYRVSAELLRVARGQVQCGRCADVFDALTFLIEDDAVEGTAPAADSDPAHDPEPGQSLEFDLPADAVERVFVEGPRVAMPPFASVAVLTNTAEVQIAEELPEEAEEIDIPLTVEESSNDPLAVAPEPGSFDEPPLIEEENSWDTYEAPEPQEPEPVQEAPQHVVEVGDIAVVDIAEPGESANEDRGATMLRPRSLSIAEDSAPGEHADFGDTTALKERAAHLGWRAGVATLGVLLFAQLVHYDRHDLVRHPTFGPILQKVYAAFGLELSPNWNLKAYQVRQWGAAAAPGSQGTLRVRASVVNTADHPQPLPLLRLSLADLAGARVGVRDFEPREYVPNLPGSDHMLGAGRRIDAEVVIVDPGKDAVGFEIDVCLRDDERHVRCANDPAPPT